MNWLTRTQPSLVWSLGALLCATACTIKIEDTAGGSASGSSGEASTGGASSGEATGGGSDSTTSGGGSDSATSGVTTSAGMTSSTTSATSDGTTTTSGQTSGVGTTGGSACDCGVDEYCAWQAHTCGADPSDSGVCMTRPEACDAVYQPVCGCDLMVYGNECDAQMAGVDVAIDGGCQAPEGYFPCGSMFCDLQTTYCERQLSDVVGFPDTFACKPLPDTCNPIECACLADVPCGGSCEVVDFGGLTVSCPGG